LPDGKREWASGTLQESEVEGCEYKDDSYVDGQPFPEPILEEQEIHRDDNGCHQHHVKYVSRLVPHFNPRFNTGASAQVVRALRSWSYVQNMQDACRSANSEWTDQLGASSSSGCQPRMLRIRAGKPA
jgi:hypothetical protein